MKAHKTAIGNNEPSFIWHMFKYYSSTAEQIVRTFLAKMNNLKNTFEVLCKSNVDKFATKIICILLKLVENGGADTQDFNKCYEVLSHSPCNSFNSELMVYK